MSERKKKCWREKVTAEITVTHLQQFAQEMGTNLSTAEVAQFLNQNGLAQNVWMHMMQAGEQYIKSNLKAKFAALPPADRPKRQAAIVQWRSGDCRPIHIQ
jgi:hypothetical protein